MILVNVKNVLTFIFKIIVDALKVDLEIRLNMCVVNKFV